MEFLLPAVAVVLLSALFSAGILVLFINIGVFPRPEENDLARWLYWPAARDPRRVATTLVMLTSLGLGAITVYSGIRLLLRSREEAFFVLLLVAGMGQAALAFFFVRMRHPTRERFRHEIAEEARKIRDLLLVGEQEPRRAARQTIFELAVQEPLKAVSLLIDLLRDPRTRDLGLAFIRDIEANISLHGLVEPFRLHLDGEIRRIGDEGESGEELRVVKHLLKSQETFEAWEKAGRGKAVQRCLKRCIDVVLSFGLLIVCGAIPIIVIVALWLRLGSGSRLIFVSKRLGYRGLEFTYYEFDVGSLGNLFAKYPRVKEFLLGTGLYRLPALVNVLWGDMSMVGPGPLYFTTVNHLAEKRQMGMETVLERLGSRPGLFGVAQLDHYTSPERRGCERYVRMDIEYVQKWSLLGDMRIMGLTVKLLLVRLFPRAVRALIVGPREVREVLESGLR